MAAVSSILSIFMLCVLGIAIVIIRNLLQNASKDPETMINEKFNSKYGYLVEDLRSLRKNSSNKAIIIQWKVFYLFR
jgi:hypothetical protein